MAEQLRVTYLARKASTAQLDLERAHPAQRVRLAAGLASSVWTSAALALLDSTAEVSASQLRVGLVWQGTSATVEMRLLGPNTGCLR